MTSRVRPLSGRGADIEWVSDGAGRKVTWGHTSFYVSHDLVENLLSSYFTDQDHWYPLGAGMDKPMPGGLGEYLTNSTSLTPRHASAIAAILVAEEFLEYRGQKPIELRKGWRSRA